MIHSHQPLPAYRYQETTKRASLSHLPIYISNLWNPPTNNPLRFKLLHSLNYMTEQAEGYKRTHTQHAS